MTESKRPKFSRNSTDNKSSSSQSSGKRTYTNKYKTKPKPKHNRDFNSNKQHDGGISKRSTASIPKQTRHGNLEISPLGGCGEIGMNMTSVYVEGKWYFIDVGILFADASLPGCKGIIPDTTWYEDHKVMPEAWLITHGHEDHIGAVVQIYPRFPAPIYATPFTAEMVKNKLEEAKISDYEIRIWETGKPKQISNITVTPYGANHSIADAHGLFIETPHGNIVHTGDFRLDDKAPPEGHFMADNLKKVKGNKPVKVLLSDSTNSFSKGKDLKESDLQKDFEQIFDEAQGVIVIATFGSHVWRMRTVIEMAQKFNRKVFLLGRSLRKNYELAIRHGFLKVDPSMVYTDDDVNLNEFDRKELCVLSTGSQGEQFSGAYRLATRSYHNLQLDEGDSIIFSSRSIPGNERTISELMNQFAKLGCNVITAKEKNIHVSGHGYADDLKKIIKTAKPEHFMPVHGEYRHLQQHIRLAVEVGVHPDNCHLVPNGQVLSLSGPDEVGIHKEYLWGREYVLHGGQLSWFNDVPKERQSIAEGGHITVSYAFKEVGARKAILIQRPQWSAMGVPLEDDEFSAGLEKIFMKAYSYVSARNNFTESHLKEEIRVSLRRFAEGLIGYKPPVSILTHNAKYFKDDTRSSSPGTNNRNHRNHRNNNNPKVGRSYSGTRTYRKTN